MGVTSIWNNPKLMSLKPVPKWCFQVIFNGLSYGTASTERINNGENLNKTMSFMTESVSFGRRETSIVKTYYAGIEANLPGRCVNTGELNIVFNEDQNLSITRVLEDIFADSCCDDQFFSGKHETYTPASGWEKNDKYICIRILKPNADGIIETDNTDCIAGEYYFYNCILTSINEEEFNYSNTDEILKRTARFSYDYMQRGENF